MSYRLQSNSLQWAIVASLFFTLGAPSAFALTADIGACCAVAPSQPGPGASCLPAPPAECAAMGGIYVGPGVPCALAKCLQITDGPAAGPCCGSFSGSKCVMAPPLGCISMGGVPGAAPGCMGDFNGDGLDEACGQAPFCGNGATEGGEQCDDGNPFFGDGCTPACTFEPMPMCGNGIPEMGEQCDDGNLVLGDGCTPACTIEPMPMCGNGVTEVGEQCDDGNFAFGDGCTPSCVLEAVPACGNGVTESGEQCDDGNANFGDGCTPGCIVENLGLCLAVAGATQSCCGDGGAAGCANTLCCEAVCALDPFCCNVRWDGLCAQVAAGIAGCGCGGCQPGACGQPTGPCQTSVCDPLSGSCVSWPQSDGTPCDDGNDCTHQDICAAGACVGSPMPCDDGNSCTQDLCGPGGCTYMPIVCPVVDACTIAECISSIGCTYTTLDCADSDACTHDFCSPGGGCVHTPIPCDDGDACTVDTCTPSGGCTHVSLPCDDGIDCTFDYCSPGGGCVHEAIDAWCDDSNVCTEDACDAELGCIYTFVGDELCDDLDPCTLDLCDPFVGCYYVDNGECEVDVDIDSDNDGGVTGGPSRTQAEDGVEMDAPGKWIPFNDDDDDGNKKADRTDEPPAAAENDWVPAVLEIKPSPCKAPGKWRVAYTGGVEVYKANKTDKLASNAVQDCPLAPSPQTVQLEGVAVSGQLGSTTVTLDYDSDGNGTWDFSDTIKATVIQCDIDVDSDNNATAADFPPARDAAEDALELDADKRGRLVAVNHDDDDSDGVADFLDGYNLDGAVGVAGKPEFADNANAAEDDFVAVVVEVVAPIDPAKARLKLEYSASNPLSAPKAGIPPMPAPSAGDLRLWTKKNPRNGKSVADGGDFVPATTLDATKLGITANQRAVTLFAEGIRPSAKEGATTIKLSVDPDGDGPAGLVHSDVVRLTIFSLELAATDPDYLPTNSNTTQHEAKLLPEPLECTMEFKLTSSSIPGHSMNNGAQTGAEKDYKFVAASNPGFALSDSDQKATAAAKSKTAKITTTSFDFGGRARLQVRCTDLPAQSQARPLPLDSDNDGLPDKYEDAQPNRFFQKGNRDTDGDGTLDGEEDDDTQRPVTANAGPDLAGARTNQGLLGDGLVAFEEYRGFHIQGVHTRTVSRTKDVFVHVEANVLVGLGMFPNLTDFTVHSIRATEWGGIANRLVNEKRDASIVGATDQRALRVIRNNALAMFGLTISGPAPQSPNETDRIEIDVDDHQALGRGDDRVNAARTHIHTGANGLCNTIAGGDDVQVVAVGNGQPNSLCVLPGPNAVSNSVVAGDDVLNAATQRIDSGPNGICNTARAGDDLQALPVGRGLPNRPCVTDGANATLETINGVTAGPDMNFCTADDAPVALTAAQRTAALQETVGHECGHGVHIEHEFCFGDVQVIGEGKGQPNQTALRSGLNGICNSVRAGDDVALIPQNQGQANSLCVDGGGNGLAMGSAPAGDDVVAGATIHSGPNGVCETAKKGDDTQSLPVGQGTPNTICIHNGADGVTQTAAGGDDVQVIAVGRGAPNVNCITPGADGILVSAPAGDDVVVGQNIHTGPNGVCNSFADVEAAAPTIMTSDLLVPIPNTYSADQLNQVRMHVKHP